jgi:carboxylesterase type B
VPPQDINAGILDHFFAMNFISSNANSLGGNKNKITVWGQSYGATMLEMEMLYLKKQDVKASAGILDSCTGPVCV